MEDNKWYGRFPAYYEKTINHITKIKKRKEVTMYVPSSEDLHVKPISGDRLPMNVSTVYEYTGKIYLRNILLKLQYLAHYNEHPTDKMPKCCISIPILGRKMEFLVEESEFNVLYYSGGKQMKRGWQINIFTANDSMPTYKDCMGILNKLDSKTLANLILTALNTSLERQMDMDLCNFKSNDISNIIIFILLTHVAEAAVPSIQSLDQFKLLIGNNKNLSEEKREVEINPKHGRVPMMDKIVRAKLRKVFKGETFTNEFSETNFPIQQVEGTRKARERALKGYEIDELSDFEDDMQETFGALGLN